MGQIGGFTKQGCNVPLTTGMGTGSVFPGVQQQHGCSGYGSLSGAMFEQLNMAMAPPVTPQVRSAFEIFGKAPQEIATRSSLKALTAALTGDVGAGQQ